MNPTCTNPLRYGDHGPIPDGTPCSACNRVVSRPAMDHCHTHGWVRGPLCGRCNTAMAYVDRRMMPKAALADGDIALAALLAHASRCHDCPTLNATDIGPTGSLKPIVPSPEKPTTVRFRPNITAEIREVAKELGISFNAALSVLVTEALKERRRKNRQDGEAATARQPEQPA